VFRDLQNMVAEGGFVIDMATDAVEVGRLPMLERCSEVGSRRYVQAARLRWERQESEILDACCE
jgi:hypothetical protein